MSESTWRNHITTPEKDCCLTCKWFYQRSDYEPIRIPFMDSKDWTTGGTCRRYAPRGGGNHTREIDWCGDFERK